MGRGRAGKNGIIADIRPTCRYNINTSWGSEMNEEQVYALEIDGQFFPDDEPLRVHGTSGEVLERIADAWGIEEQDEERDAFDSDPDIIYPSVRAVRAHQMLEERMGKSGAYSDPDTLLTALIKEGFARRLTESEVDAWMEEEEMDEYEEARGELGEEWADGVWET